MVPAASNSDQPTIDRPLPSRKAQMLVENHRWYCCLQVLLPVLMFRAANWLESYEYVLHCVSVVATTSSPPQCTYVPGKRFITSVSTFVKKVHEPGPARLKSV